MAIPTGTEFYMTIHIDHHRVVQNYTGFLFQYDFSEHYDSFVPHINDATSITIYDEHTDTTCTKNIEIVGTNMYVYFLGDINTTHDTIFYVCAGKSLNFANTTTIFSTYGYAHRWAMNAASDTTVEDTAGSYTGTIVAPAHKDYPGFFGRCLANHSGVTQSGRVDFSNPVIPTTDISIEAICRFNNIDSLAQYLLGTNKFYLRTSTQTHRLVMSSNYSQQATSLAYLPEGEWCHILVTRNSSGTAVFYINGINRTDASASGTPATSTTNLVLSNS